jgi:hypothetical protein
LGDKESGDGGDKAEGGMSSFASGGLKFGRVASGGEDRKTSGKKAIEKKEAGGGYGKKKEARDYITD